MVVMLYNALMMTGAFSRNVSKLFSELKLVTNDLNVVLILHVSILYMYICLLYWFPCGMFLKTK